LGWFINGETDVDAETAQQLEEMVNYMQEHKKTNDQIIWYDALLPNG